MLQLFLVMLVAQKLHTSPTGQQRTKNGKVFSLRFAYKCVKTIPVHMDPHKTLKTLNYTSQVMSLFTEMLSAYAHSYRLNTYYTYTLHFLQICIFTVYKNEQPKHTNSVLFLFENGVV